MSDEHWTGGCNCKAIRYTVSGSIESPWICHCEPCVRYHGHAGAYTKCDQEQFSLDEDQGLAWWRHPNGERRGFCRICGSSLFSVEASRPEIMFITVGTLDDTGDHTVTKHMCFNEKPSYYEINDELIKLDYHE